MKNYLIATLFAFSACANATVINGFTEAFDVANFTQTINGGSINTSGAPDSISLTSSNIGNGNTNQDFTIVSANDATIKFDFSFVTTDVDGATFDPFGFLLNGIFTKLSNDSGPDSQNGSETFLVLAGNTFGFRENALDSVLGASTTTISNFSATSVPEPTSIALLGLGLFGFTVSRRKVGNSKNI